MESAGRIRRHIADILKRKGIDSKRVDSPRLVTDGLLDSLDIVRVVVFLEKEWRIDFSKGPFRQDDFDSVSRIAALVDARKASQ